MATKKKAEEPKYRLKAGPPVAFKQFKGKTLVSGMCKDPLCIVAGRPHVHPLHYMGRSSNVPFIVEKGFWVRVEDAATNRAEAISNAEFKQKYETV